MPRGEQIAKLAEWVTHAAGRSFSVLRGGRHALSNSAISTAVHPRRWALFWGVPPAPRARPGGGGASGGPAGGRRAPHAPQKRPNAGDTESTKPKPINRAATTST